MTVIDFHQQVLNPNGRQPGINHPLQSGDRIRDRRFILAFQFELAVVDFGKGVQCKLLVSHSRRFMKLLGEAGSYVRGSRAAEARRTRPLSTVCHLGSLSIKSQKETMVFALRQVEIPGPQGIFDG